MLQYKINFFLEKYNACKNSFYYLLNNLFCVSEEN